MYKLCYSRHRVSRHRVSRHRFPPSVIQHSIWLYLRFTLSYRDVEDLLAERGMRKSRSGNLASEQRDYLG